VAIRVAGREARARLVINGLQLIRSPIFGDIAQTVNHGEELRWIVFPVKMWKGQPAYIELLDEGPGYVAISEAWFSYDRPPTESGVKVALPDLPEPGDEAEVKKLIDRIQEPEAKTPTARRALPMRDTGTFTEHIFVRGNHKIQGDMAPRAFLEAFGKP